MKMSQFNVWPSHYALKHESFINKKNEHHICIVYYDYRFLKIHQENMQSVTMYLHFQLSTNIYAPVLQYTLCSNLTILSQLFLQLSMHSIYTVNSAAMSCLKNQHKIFQSSRILLRKRLEPYIPSQIVCSTSMLDECYEL